MSVNLLHGPAGSGKTDFLLSSLWEKYGAHGHADQYLLVVPSLSSVEPFQKRLLEEIPTPSILVGDSIVPFDRFLLRLLKFNLPRLHQATSSITRNIIRNLLFNNNYNYFDKWKKFSGIVSELALTVVHLKKNGLDPERARTFFRRYKTDALTDIMALFDDYQKALREIYYYDEGDLYSESLNLLRRGQLKLPEGLKALYFDRIFPFTLGQREMIKELSQRFPHLDIVISYSFDYQAGEDPYFYPAYNFLGELASNNEYFHLTNLEKQEFYYSFTDPASEIEWAVSQIKERVKEGTSPNRIGILLPSSSFYHQRFNELFERENIPFSPTFAPFLKRFSNLKPGQIEQLIELALEKPSQTLDEAASALAQLDEFEKKWIFEKNLIFRGMNDFDQLQKWKSDELSRTHLKTRPSSSGVRLFNIADSSAYDLDELFIVGFTDQHYPSPIKEHPFYSTEMMLDTNAREILEGPVYKQGLEKQRLVQLINRTKKRAYFTYPKITWDRKEQVPSRLYAQNQEYIQNREQQNSTNQIHIQSLAQKIKFPNSIKNQFSISEIETYLKCPYQYYARYQLKLGDKEKEDLDVPADVKGSFVHRVMQRLFEEQLDLYGEAIEYDLYLNKLVERAKEIIADEKEKDAFLKMASEPIRNFFSERVLSVIGSELKGEINQIREKKKNTYPRYFEWSFGKKNIPALRLKCESQEIFISGRIDRIDVNKDLKTFLVIDYKTGELSSGTKLKLGESLQIPLYMMAAEKLLLKDFKPAGGIFIGFKDLTKKSGLLIQGGGEEQVLKKNYQISQEDWKILQNKIILKVGDIAKQINQGNFSPNPQSNSLCRFCDYRDICHYSDM